MRIIITCFIFLQISYLPAQICTSTQPINVPDEAIRNIKYKVENLQNDNLSSNEQGVCGVKLNLKHEFIGDIRVSLISPSGQEVTLLGPTGKFGLTQFSNFDLTFVPCQFQANPDIGFSAQWENNQPWGAFGNFNGSYYPQNGCLEDFNDGLANGTWILQVEDAVKFGEGVLESFELIFCDPTGLDCEQCGADAGIIDPININSCVGDQTLDFELNPFGNIVQPDLDVYSYKYVIARNGSITSFNDNADASGFEMGTYEICGLSIETVQLNRLTTESMNLKISQLDSILNEPGNDYCGSISSNCLSITLKEFEIVIDSIAQICQGDSIFFNDIAYVNTGTYQEILGDCDTLFSLDLEVIEINASITDNSEIFGCETDLIELDASSSFYSNTSSISWMTPNGIITSDPFSELVSISQPGQYFFNITEEACMSSDSIIISANVDVPRLELSAAPLNCNSNESQIFLNSNIDLASVSWIGPEGFQSFAENPLINKEGLYIVNVIGVNNCETAASIQVELDLSGPLMEFRSDTLNCENFTAKINFIGGEIPAFFNWEGPDNFVSNELSPIVTLPGDYTINATGADGCSGDIVVNVVNDQSIPELLISATSLNCVRDSVQLRIQNDEVLDLSSIQWYNINGSPFSGQRPYVNLPGIYELVVTGSNGCVANIDVEVVRDTIKPDIQIIGDQLACSANSVTLMGITSSDDTRYRWTGPDGFFSEVSNPRVTEPGVYILELIASNSCNAVASFFLQENADIPDVQILNQSLDCNNPDGMLEIIGSDDFVYTWTGADGFFFEGKIPADLEVGTYSLNVQDPTADCSAIFPVIISENFEEPDPLILISDIDCQSDTARIEIVNDEGMTFAWSGPQMSNEANPIITVPGLYEVLITGNNGCSNTKRFEVKIDKDTPSLSAQDVNQNNCREEIFLTAQSDDLQATYTWFGPNNYFREGERVLPSESGEYKVVVESQGGCKDSTVISFVAGGVPPDLDVSFVDTISCTVPNTLITVTSDIDNVTFFWEGPNDYIGTTAQINVGEPGLYRVEVTAPDQCKSSAVINIPSQVLIPDVQILADTALCDVSQVSINVLNAKENFIYEWRTPRGEMIQSTDLVTTEAGRFILTTISNDQCVALDTVYAVFDNEIPELDFIAPDTLNCIRNFVAVGANTNAEGNHSYHWTGPDNFDSFQQFPIISQAGVYNLEFVAANGCRMIQSVVVEQDTIPPFISTVGGELSCGVSKIDIMAETNEEYLDVFWTGPNDFSSEILAPIVIDTGLYTVTIQGENGCYNTQELLIRGDFEKPEIITSDGYLNCDGSTVELFYQSRDLGVTVQWFGPNDFYSIEPNPSINIAGEYILIAEGINGCTKTDTIFMSDEPQLPIFQVFDDSLSCSETTLNLNASLPENFNSLQWTGPDNFESIDISPRVDNPGVYTLVVTGTNGCIDSRNLMISTDTVAPMINLEQTDILKCDNRLIQIEGMGTTTGLVNYNWTSEDGNIVSGQNTLNPIIDQEGWYYLNVSNLINGCMNQDSIFIEEEPSDIIDVEVISLDPTCQGLNDGQLVIDTVYGGTLPLSYSLDGDNFVLSNTFDLLSLGDFEITVIDSFGCRFTTEVTLSSGPELSVSLQPDLKVTLGDSIRVVAEVSNPSYDSIRWYLNEALLEAEINEVYLNIVNESVIRVEVTLDGCKTFAESIIKVDKQGDIYVPNVFTPEKGEINHLFTAYKSESVAEISSIAVFDRFGDRVYYVEHLDSENDAWDGRMYDGQDSALPGVYIYVVNYIKKDGEVKSKRGTVTLIR